ncbi:MAG: CHASE2 domain-containing protein [Vicinamibacterales bacterium]
MHRRLVAGLAIGLAAAAMAALLGSVSFFQTVEWKAYDVRMRWTADPASASRDIVLVAIDEDSIEKLEPLVGRWPWPRLVHAQVLDFISRAPAKVVAYDVLFSERDLRRFRVGEEEWTGEESDQALVEAVTRSGNVVLAAEASREGRVDSAGTEGPGSAPELPGPRYNLGPLIEERPALALPAAGLSRAARGIGHTFTVLDPDGPVRRYVPFVLVGGTAVPSLALAAAAVADDLYPSEFSRGPGCLLIARECMPLVEGDIPSFYGDRKRSYRSLIRYQGGVLMGGVATYRQYSFYSLFYSEAQLRAGEKPLVDPGELRNKVVIVGTTAAGLLDLFTTPFGEGKMPGIEVHANVIDNVLARRFMRPASLPANAGALLAVSLAAGAAAASVGVAWAAAALLLVLAGLGWLSLALFSDGVWLRMTAPVLGAALATFGGVAYQYFVEGREKRMVKALFSRFVSPEVYRQLLADPASAALGGTRREMTVLFSDIRGFTSISERGQPEEIVRQLNEYFSRMVQVVFRHHGTVDKFVGDMVMALFGAPVEDPDHADHAVCAAIDMITELEALNLRWASEGRPQVDIGIGINSGPMVAGNIGSDQIMSYTVIGDAVNLGSRLESLNKEYGTRIIASGETVRRLKGRYDISPLGHAVVKGRTAPVEIHTVRGQGPPAGGR